MGQNASFEEGSLASDILQDDVLRSARVFSEIAVLSYEEFVKQLGELNKLSNKCLDANGKKLVFAVKKGTDSTILWKGTVKIACVKIDPATSSVESYRLLHLAEFLQVFKTLQGHMRCIEVSKRRLSESDESTSRENLNSGSMIPNFTASMLLEHVDQISSGKVVLDKSVECCICLERKPEVILPCAHSYCLPCIERWNVNNKTCPICREKLESTDDTWVISDAPEVDEITAEICSSLNELSQLSPKHQFTQTSKK